MAAPCVFPLQAQFSDAFQSHKHTKQHLSSGHTPTVCPHQSVQLRYLWKLGPLDCYSRSCRSATVWSISREIFQLLMLRKDKPLHQYEIIHQHERADEYQALVIAAYCPVRSAHHSRRFYSTHLIVICKQPRFAFRDRWRYPSRDHYIDDCSMLTLFGQIDCRRFDSRGLQRKE